MDRIHELPPRSASMPSPGTVLPPGYLQPIPRKLSARRDSEMVLSDGPITPPESPGPEDMITDQIPQPPVEIIIGDRQNAVSIDYPATPVSQPPETPDAMEEDAEPNEEIVSAPISTARSLSEEITMPGTYSLKLTDFEVRGTLG